LPRKSFSKTLQRSKRPATKKVHPEKEYTKKKDFMHIHNSRADGQA